MGTAVVDIRTYWTGGGCGAFATALVARWPHLKIAVDLYSDHGEDRVSHCWAYDGTRKYDIFGSEEWEPSEDPFGYDSTRVLLDQSAADVDALFLDGVSENSIWDAEDVVDEMFG